MKGLRFLVSFMVVLSATACEKEDIEDIIAKEQIKIFMSMSSEGSEEINNELKSGTTKEVFNGDTILIHSRSVNALIWAENKFGEEIKGAWRASLLTTDFSSELSEYPLNYIFGYSGADYVSQMSFKFPEFGVYEISIGKYEDRYNHTGYQSKITFYIKVIGTPGFMGDDFRNNCIFRIEKKYLNKSLVGENVFVIYYKYNGKYKGYYCWLEDIEYYPAIKRRSIKMQKWPYSRPGDDYQYLVIKGLKGSYTLNFMGTDDQCDGINCGILDQNAIKSSWWDDYNNGIVLTIP